MKRVNMHDAKTHLSRYVSGLKGKESLILCNRNRPVAELRPLPPKAGKPRIGVAKGEFVVPEAFFEPLPNEILKAFGRKKSS
jgi:antitoxin (DNA-binding transcriptional repressor) of toxin-antitoxin stability system